MRWSFVYTIFVLFVLVAITLRIPSKVYELTGHFTGMVMLAFFVAGFVTLYWLGLRFSGYWRKRLYRQRLAELLQGETLPEALASSRYTISHAQGESGYQIAGLDAPAEPVATGLGYEEATLWVLEQRQKTVTDH